MKTLQENNSPYSFGQRLLAGVFVLGAVVLVVWNLKLFVEDRVLDELYESGNSRAAFYTGSLRDSLEKYRHLPYVLARDSRIQGLLKGEFEEVKVNPHLEDFAGATGALIFVLDQGGTTLAASNWRTEQSLLGHNYNFRPYFLDARNGKPGGYYAVGLQTRKPGFFISYPVFDVGEMLGVVVVKVNLVPLEKSWQEGNEIIMVSDAYGVLILSSNDDWTYTTLQPLSPQTRKRLRLNQYLETSLATLPVRRENTRHGNILYIHEIPYLEISRQLPDYGWRLHYLVAADKVSSMGRLTVFGSLSFLAMLSLLLLYSHERKQRLISRQEARDAREIRELNLRLREEVEEHTRTEESLRNTQQELIQAGKLAALGRMSAAVAHELNQPVTAIRTFLASCRIFIERGQIEKVEQNISLISSLTDRMARITGQLKDFSRKNTGRNKTVDLVERITRVLEFTDPELKKEMIVVKTTMPSPGTVLIQGDSVRIEQVVNNVLQNAIRAVRGRDLRLIHIDVGRDADWIVAAFEDSGTGIEDEALENLFEPFFTMRKSGEGLGLGLSISYGIMQDLGGNIRGENSANGGARFTLRFPHNHDAEAKEKIK